MNKILKFLTALGLIWVVSTEIGCLDPNRTNRRKLAKIEKQLQLAYKDGEVKQIEKCLIDAITLNPNADNHKNSLAILYASKLNEHEKAKILWEELLKKDPQNSAYINNLAGIYQITGDFERAIKLYNDAKVGLDTYHMPYYNIGRILMSQRRYAEAVVELKEGISRTKRDTIMIFTLARAYILNDNILEAETVLRKEILSGEISLINNLLLQRILIRNGKFEEATEVLNNLITNNPDNLAFLKAEYIQLLVFKKADHSEILSELSLQEKLSNPQIEEWFPALIRAELMIQSGNYSDGQQSLLSLEAKIPRDFFQFEATRQHFLSLCHEHFGKINESYLAKQQAFDLAPELFANPDATKEASSNDLMQNSVNE